MNVFLMQPEGCGKGEDAAPAPASAGDLAQDLALEMLWQEMAQGDEFLYGVAKQTILASTHNDVETILYRQAILRDCLAHPSVTRALYEIAVEAIASERKIHFGFFSKSPDMILRRAVEVLQLFEGRLRALRRVAEEEGGLFASEGLRRLMATLRGELNDEFFGAVAEEIEELAFREGILISARLGKGNKGTDYTLRKWPEKQQGWAGRLFGSKAPGYNFTIAPRDLNGMRAVLALRDQGINLVANALAQSSDHVLGFFEQLRRELAFYMGCLNLVGQMERLGAATCFPTPAPAGERRLQGQGIYDLCLALVLRRQVVSNEVAANGRDLLLITGANQGGKSTFLRSVGLAQLMMQSGMVVAAEAFSANVCAGLYTHFRREEDAAMESGKLDEELRRMSAIVDRLRPNALLLCNESFAATNEREGAEIARQIVGALVEGGVKVYFVTHLYALARGLYDERREESLFLRAERRTDGRRTFRIEVGEPLETSFGADLYERIFSERVR